MSNQVFYTHSKKRWKRFLWTTRIFFALVFVIIVVTLISVLGDNGANLPHFLARNDVYKKVLNPDFPFVLKNTQNKDFKNNIHYFKNKHKNIQYKYRNSNGIRAGFYVNWDVQSFYSLRDNIDKMNVVFPECFFLAGTGDSIVVDINAKALKILKEHKTKVLPIVTNFSGNDWNGTNISKLLMSSERRKRLISSIIKNLKKYNFSGVNIDFEELKLKTDEYLISFQRELYEALHKRGYIVTQDISPANDDYNLAELSKYNDYIVVMAYDQHFATSVPGPIADQKWVEDVLDNVLKSVPDYKIIVGLAAYGYDWPEKSEASDVTYIESIVTAKESEATIDFDNDNYNLNYTYFDDNNIKHTVYFTDAATSFNIMRSSCDAGINNFAVWRLGSEDSRIWKYYSTDLGYFSLKSNNFDFSKLTTVKDNQNVDFFGEGEVLDMVAFPQAGKIDLSVNKDEFLISEENYSKLPTSYVIKKYGKAPQKTILLTFDDGPDEEYTPQILDILKKEKVPAAFFVIGENAEKNLHILKRMYKEGYEIGNHSFTHPNLADIGNENARIELNLTRRIIECVTGHTTFLFRPPYNADSEPETYQELAPIEVAKKENYYTIGESIDPEDWQIGISAEQIMQRIKEREHLGSIILLHDAGGDRSATVKALPMIIKYFKDKGYRFITVSELIGKKRDILMPQLKQSDLYAAYFNWGVADTIYWLLKFITTIFILGIVLSVLRMLIIGILAYYQKRKNKHVKLNYSKPKVSVIVPAYNEEVNAVKTINSILKCDYPDLNIVFVDDGSKDNTYNIVFEAFRNNEKVKVVTKTNGGKPSALNYGISVTDADFIVCIDADTILRKDAITELMQGFYDEHTGAVAGNVKVGNEKNFITKWQAIEYISSQNFDRRAFDALNCITVVPGAIGAFRRKAVIEVGGFTQDTLAEDSDLTFRLLENDYTVTYVSSAHAITEAPETIKMFLKQRFRWSFGVLQTFWKHKHTLFNPEYGALGMVAMPNILIFQFLLPLISPIADLVMLLSLLTGYFENTLLYYLAFIFVDAFGAAIAFSFEKEKLSRLWLLFPQRFFYRQLMYWVLIKTIISVFKGELVHWGSLHRTGSVKVN